MLVVVSGVNRESIAKDALAHARDQGQPGDKYEAWFCIAWDFCGRGEVQTCIPLHLLQLALFE